MGLPVWCQDQAGPFQTVPYPGASWQPEGKPIRQPHQYFRNGTAKLMALFHHASGHLRAKGVTSCQNSVLHPWLKQELSEILTNMSAPEYRLESADIRRIWSQWYEGLSILPAIPGNLPPLRMLLVQDNLAGHKSSEFVEWCFQNGIALLYTPLGGSWLNMAESIQGIIERRSRTVGRAASSNPRRDYQMVRSHGAWLEPESDSVCVGRKKGGTS